MRIRLLSVAPGLLGLFASVTALLAAPSVDEKVVGPATQGGLYTVSLQGGHIAYAGVRGTQKVVIVDGVDGPLVDELFGPSGQGFFHSPQLSVMPASNGGQTTKSPMMPVIFTDDGAHYAYAARRGGDYVVIHDGKEVGRGPVATLALNYGPLTLSPTGRHVFWNEMKTEPAGASWRLMISGQPGPWSGHQNMLPVFSGDDSRHAFNAGKLGNYQEQMLIVDGKDAGYAGVKPLFTADGKLLLSTRAEPKAAVLVDGKPVVEGFAIEKLVTAPSGRRWGAIVRTKIVNGLAVGTFFLEGKEVAGTEGAQAVAFSPDGKRYAVVCVNAATRTAFLVIDGKAGPTFEGVSEQSIQWTPDGGKVIYSAVAKGRNVVVVNDESRVIDALMGREPIILARTGGAYAFSTMDGANRNFTVVVDGKSVLPAGLAPAGGTLAFSPDGTRHGYFYSLVGRGDLAGVVVDGQPVEGLAPVMFGKWHQMDLVTPALVFSPDSKHVAYLARTADPAAQGVYVDGQLAFATSKVPYFPTFTPDSQHLFWATTEFTAGKPPALVIYADGREVIRPNANAFSNSAGIWTMDTQGVLTVFAAEGDAVKRFRIKASGDTSLATMAADVTTARTQATAAAQAKQEAAAEAAVKAKADQQAAAAKAKADYEAAVAAKAKARQEAIEAKTKARQDALKAKQEKK